MPRHIQGDIPGKALRTFLNDTPEQVVRQGTLHGPCHLFINRPPCWAFSNQEKGLFELRQGQFRVISLQKDLSPQQITMGHHFPVLRLPEKGAQQRQGFFFLIRVHSDSRSQEFRLRRLGGPGGRLHQRLENTSSLFRFTK